MRIVILAAFACLLAAPAAAIVDDGINSLGVYFDHDGNVNCFSPYIFTPFNLYYILAHPTPAALGEYEFGWRFTSQPTPAIVILTKAFPLGARNAGDDHSFHVTIDGGLPTSEATVLAVLNVMALAPIPPGVYLTVGPPTQPSLPGHAAFASPTDATPVPMAFHCYGIDGNGWAVPGVLAFQWPHPDATEAATWGEVKSLFRD